MDGSSNDIGAHEDEYTNSSFESFPAVVDEFTYSLLVIHFPSSLVAKQQNTMGKQHNVHHS